MAAASTAKILRIPPPTAGIDTDSSPNYGANNRGVVLQNFLPQGAGHAALRNGVFGGIAASPASAARSTKGWLSVGNKLLVSANPSGNNAMKGDFDALTFTNTTLAGSPVISGPSVEINGYAYSVDVTSGKVCRWDGVTFAVLNNGPTGLAPWSPFPGMRPVLANHLGRLWVGGGTAPGGATTSLTSLFWTSASGSPTDQFADWKDPVSGLVNQITLDNEASNPILAVGRVGPYLGVIRLNSLWLLTGTDSTSFAVKQRVSGVGMSAYGGNALEFGDSLIWQAPRGLIQWDGTSIVELTAPISQDFPTGSIRWLAALDDEWIMVGTSQLGYPVYLCHVPTRSWATVTYDSHVQDLGGPSGSGPLVGNLASGRAFTFDGYSKAFLMSTYDGSAIHRETTNVGGFVGVDNGATGLYPVTAKYATSVRELGAPMQKSVIQRVMVDYYYEDTIVRTPGLRLTLYAEDGQSVIGGPYTLPRLQTSAWGRATFDVFAETTAVQAVVTFGDSTAPTVASVSGVRIGDIWLEYQPAQQARS